MAMITSARRPRRAWSRASVDARGAEGGEPHADDGQHTSRAKLEEKWWGAKLPPLGVHACLMLKLEGDSW
jgi:hypothetical protein